MIDMSPSGGRFKQIEVKEEGDNNRCHMKIETSNPQMPNERQVVDCYGPCDERPAKR